MSYCITLSQCIKQYFSYFLECKNVEYTETIQLYGKVCSSILLFVVVVHVTSLLQQDIGFVRHYMQEKVRHKRQQQKNLFSKNQSSIATYMISHRTMQQVIRMEYWVLMIFSRYLEYYANYETFQGLKIIFKVNWLGICEQHFSVPANKYESEYVFSDWSLQHLPICA